MNAPKLRPFDPNRQPEPQFFVQTPDDLDEVDRLNKRPGAHGILRALLRLIRRAHTEDRSVVCTYEDIRREAGVKTTKTVGTHVRTLKERGYLVTETIIGPSGWSTRKTLFKVVYQLRGNLKLEADPPTVSGLHASVRRKKTTSRKGKKTTSSLGEENYLQALFEQRNTNREEREESALAPSITPPEPLDQEDAPAPPVPPPAPTVPPPIAIQAPEPDEQTTGRTGDEHRQFVQVWRDLRNHAPTAHLASELVMAADTPAVRTVESWRLWVGCRVVHQPDRPKSWGCFIRSALCATEAEYESRRSQEDRGRPTDLGEKPPVYFHATKEQLDLVYGRTPST
jgi:hypothetical protein